MAKNQYVSERGGYTFRTQVFTTTDEDGDARFEPEIRHHVGHTGIAGRSELPGGSSGEFSHYDLRGHKAAEEIADEETDDSFFH